MIGIVSAISLMFQQLYSMEEIKAKDIAYFDRQSNVYIVINRGRYSIGSLTISGNGGYLMPQFGDNVRSCSSDEFRCIDVGILKLAIPSKGFSRRKRFLFNGYSHEVSSYGDKYSIIAKCVDRNACKSSASPLISIVNRYELKYDGSGNLMEARIHFNGGTEGPVHYFHLKAITKNRIKV